MLKKIKKNCYHFRLFASDNTRKKHLRTPPIGCCISSLRKLLKSDKYYDVILESFNADSDQNQFIDASQSKLMLKLHLIHSVYMN